MSAGLFTAVTILKYLDHFHMIPFYIYLCYRSQVVADFVASMQAQFSRKEPELWGAMQAFDVNSEAYTTGGWQTAFDYIKTYPQTPSTAQLRAGRLTELDAQYTIRLQVRSCAKWVQWVLIIKAMAYIFHLLSAFRAGRLVEMRTFVRNVQERYGVQRTIVECLRMLRWTMSDFVAL